MPSATVLRLTQPSTYMIIHCQKSDLTAQMHQRHVHMWETFLVPEMTPSKMSSIVVVDRSTLSPHQIAGLVYDT